MKSKMVLSYAFGIKARTSLSARNKPSKPNVAVKPVNGQDFEAGMKSERLNAHVASHIEVLEVHGGFISNGQ